MNNLKSIAANGAKVFMIILAIASVSKGVFIAAVFYAIGAASLMPVVQGFILSKTKFDLSKYKLHASIGGFIIASAFLPKPPVNTPPPVSAIEAIPAKAPITEGEANAQMMEDIKSDMDRLNNFPSSTYRGKTALLSSGVDIIESIYATGNISSKSDVDSIRVAGTELLKKAIALKIKEYPSIRKDFTNNASDILFKNDIDVRCSGHGYRSITFINGAYSLNSVTLEHMDLLRDALKKFRFKEVSFAWYSGQDDPVTYKLDTKKDSE